MFIVFQYSQIQQAASTTLNDLAVRSDDMTKTEKHF